MAAAPALVLQGLRKAYQDVIAVTNLDLEVRPGECFGLLGPNGAGKTTTIEICEGLTTADAGEVRVLGQTWAEGGQHLRERLGISLQETQFSDKLTVEETLRLFGSFYRRPRLKRLVATPMPKAAYLGSFLISRLGLLVIEAGVLLVFASLAFGVPIRGSWWTLALTCVLSSLAFAGFGLLIAARPRTIEGASGLMNLAMVPMWVFSGVFFSASRFPEVIQPLVQALPLTAVNDALRASMLEGATFSQLLPELTIVTAWSVGTFLLALKLFRWQ